MDISYLLHEHPFRFHKAVASCESGAKIYVFQLLWTHDSLVQLQIWSVLIPLEIVDILHIGKTECMSVMLTCCQHVGTPASSPFKTCKPS